MRRVISSVVVIALLWGFSPSVFADPVYIGGQNLDVHSWQSGEFSDDPGAPIDHMQFLIDTTNTSATFEIGSSQLSSGWTVNTDDTQT